MCAAAVLELHHIVMFRPHLEHEVIQTQVAANMLSFDCGLGFVYASL